MAIGGVGLIESDTLLTGLRRIVGDHPDQPFLDFSGEGFTYSEFLDRATALAQGLITLGIGPGDTVATLLDNGPDAALVWFATNMVGGIAVPINTAYVGEYLRHPLDESSSRVIFAEADYVARILEIQDGLNHVEVIVQRGSHSLAAHSTVRIEHIDSCRIDQPRSISHDVQSNDLALLIYTSGTTGRSKGCKISHNMLCHMARTFVSFTTRRPDELYWTPLPLFHLNAAAFTVGSSILLGASASIAPRFSVSQFWEEIERTGARIVTPLGAMVPLIAECDDSAAMRRCKGQIRVAVGAPFPPQLTQIWRDRFGVEIVGSPGYGTTEVGVALYSVADQPANAGSSGERTDDFDVRIVDDVDQEVPPNEVGELIVRPRKPHIMFEGYWRQPQATLDTLRNLWFHTGDLGKFDDDGYFYFVDRKKDYLRRRGENISSFELESVFLEHPDVAEVAVHAVPSGLSEDEVKITVVLRPGSQLDEEELCEWSIGRVPYFAVPRFIEFRPELPRNAVGRVLKYKLREEGATKATWDREAAGLVVARR